MENAKEAAEEGMRLAEEGRREEAESCLRRAVRLSTEEADFRALLAEFLAASSSTEKKEEAKEIFLSLIREDPSRCAAWNNLGNLLCDSGHLSAARTAYTAAISCAPNDARPHLNLANVLLDRNELDSARTHYETALALSPGLADAHRGLSIVYHRQGETEKAAIHRRLGFGDNYLASLDSLPEGESASLLILASALEGNIPWRFLLDRNLFSATIVAVEHFSAQLPPHDLIFNAIGDADLCREGLAIAGRLVAKSDKAVINPPGRVMKTGRIENADRLGRIPGVRTPRMKRLAKRNLAAARELGFPLLLRSPGFHGGSHFLRVDDPAGLTEAAASLPGEEILAIEFMGGAREDGFYRKFRVMAIGGVLYPLHLAMSHDWKVHYFTSEMEKDERCRAEERDFLRDFAGFLGKPAVSALSAISDEIGLDLCGIDFGIGPAGEILLYEANATMNVYPPAKDERWDYRREAIEAVIRAAKEMFRQRLVASSGKKLPP